MAGNATSDLPNTRAEEVATPETDDAITSFVIESLPLRETYVSMQRVRYQPGVELAEQPIDGPKLIQILSGSLIVVTAAPGATAYRPPIGVPARCLNREWGFRLTRRRSS